MITLVALFLSGGITDHRTSQFLEDPGYRSMEACVKAGEALKRQHPSWFVSFSCLRK